MIDKGDIILHIIKPADFMDFFFAQRVQWRVFNKEFRIGFVEDINTYLVYIRSPINNIIKSYTNRDQGFVIIIEKRGNNLFINGISGAEELHIKNQIEYSKDNRYIPLDLNLEEYSQILEKIYESHLIDWDSINLLKDRFLYIIKTWLTIYQENNPFYLCYIYNETDLGLPGPEYKLFHNHHYTGQSLYLLEDLDPRDITTLSHLITTAFFKNDGQSPIHKDRLFSKMFYPAKPSFKHYLKRGFYDHLEVQGGVMLGVLFDKSYTVKAHLNSKEEVLEQTGMSSQRYSWDDINVIFQDYLPLYPHITNPSDKQRRLFGQRLQAYLESQIKKKSPLLYEILSAQWIVR